MIPAGWEVPEPEPPSAATASEGAPAIAPAAAARATTERMEGPRPGTRMRLPLPVVLRQAGDGAPEQDHHHGALDGRCLAVERPEPERLSPSQVELPAP